MVVPVDPDVDEAQDVAQEHRHDRARAVEPSPCGTFISSTMMVMMMAMTPSLNASSRVLLISNAQSARNGSIRAGTPAHGMARMLLPNIRDWGGGRTPALLLTLLLTGPVPQQPRLSDEQIDQVIAYAHTGEGLGGVRCYAAGRRGDRSEFSGGFAVMLTGPGGASSTR